MTRRGRLLAAFAALLALSGCGGSAPSAPADGEVAGAVKAAFDDRETAAFLVGDPHIALAEQATVDEVRVQVQRRLPPSDERQHPVVVRISGICTVVMPAELGEPGTTTKRREPPPKPEERTRVMRFSHQQTVLLRSDGLGGWAVVKPGDVGRK